LYLRRELIAAKVLYSVCRPRLSGDVRCRNLRRPAA